MTRTSRWLASTAVMVAAMIVSAMILPIPTVGASVGSPGDDGSCPQRELAPTFAPLLDPISYFPLPDGDFEAGAAGWALRGGARVAAGTNQTLLHLPESGGHSHALVLPPGSSARAATVCVEGTAPVMRFFAKPAGLLGALVVVVTATDESGDTQVLLSPVVPLLPWWSAPMAAFRLPWLGDHLTQVTIEFRSVGLSPVLVDDVYVDPLRQR